MIDEKQVHNTCSKLNKVANGITKLASVKDAQVFYKNLNY